MSLCLQPHRNKQGNNVKTAQWTEQKWNKFSKKEAYKELCHCVSWYWVFMFIIWVLNYFVCISEPEQILCGTVELLVDFSNACLFCNPTSEACLFFKYIWSSGCGTLSPIDKNFIISLWGDVWNLISHICLPVFFCNSCLLLSRREKKEKNYCSLYQVW